MGDDWDDEVAAPVAGAVEVVNTAELPEIQLFGKWSCDEVNVSDMSLQVNFLFFKLKDINLCTFLNDEFLHYHQDLNYSEDYVCYT